MGSKKVIPTEDYKLYLTFEYDENKVFDIKPLLNQKQHEQLKDIQFFMKAHCDGTSVAWSEDYDMAPEYLYENSVPLENQVD